MALILRGSRPDGYDNNLTPEEIDNNNLYLLNLIKSLSSGSSIIKDFNPAIDFDVASQYMEVVQDKDINISLASMTGKANALAVLFIATNGIHAINISPDFEVLNKGALTNTGIYDLELHLYRSKIGVQPTCRVVPKLKSGVAGGASSSGENTGVTPLTTPTPTVTATPTGFSYSYTNIVGNNGYQLKYSKDSTLASNATTLSIAKDVVSGSINGLTSGDTYYVAVRAIGSANNNSPYSTPKSVLVASGGTQTLATPANNKLTATGTFASAVCNPVANAMQYQFNLATDNAFTQNVVQVISATPEASFSGLTPDGVTYYSKVQAQSSGFKSSEFSNIASAITQLGNDPNFHIYSFTNGNDQEVINLASSVGLFSGTNPFSVIFNTKVNPNGRLQISQGSNTERGMDIILDNGSIGVTLEDAAGNYLYYAGYAYVPNNSGPATFFVKWDGTSNADAVQVLRNGETVSMALQAQGVFTGIKANNPVRVGAVVGDRSNLSYIDDLYIINDALTATQFAEIYPVRQRNQLSFSSKIVAYLRFENNLLDETAKHHGSAISPVFVTSIPS